MAKSSLSFTDRKRVKVLNTAGALQLERADCGTVFILNSVKGHTITLPTAHKAGPGWNARFIVGTVQNDLSDRTTSSIVAQGSETVTIVKATTTGAGAATGTAAAAESLDFNGYAADDVFTITVPVAAGGTGTTFTFTFVANDAALTDADEMTAGNFQISADTEGANAMADIAAAVMDLINGAADNASVAVRKPQSGEGIFETGIQGITATVTNAEFVTITVDVVGAAGDGVALTEGAGDNVIEGATIGAIGGATAGVAATGVSASGQTITVAPSGVAKGDQIEICEVNDKWQVRAIHSA